MLTDVDGALIGFVTDGLSLGTFAVLVTASPVALPLTTVEVGKFGFEVTSCCSNVCNVEY